MKTVSTIPNVEQLVRCANLLARCLSVAPVPETQARNAIEDVLFTRGNWEAAKKRIITPDELRDLVLAHLHCALATSDTNSHTYSVGREPWQDAGLLRCIEAALVWE